MKRLPAVLACSVSIVVAGCVSLDVKPLQDEATGKGVTYRLPFTQFKGIQIRRLVACDPAPKIVVKLESVTVVSAPDWTRRYEIDMHSLSSTFKTSALKVERYPNKQLKSINAEADDRTAAVIGSVFSTVFKFVSPLSAAGGAEDSTICLDATKKVLATVVSTKTALKAKTAEVAEQTARLNHLLERARLAESASDDLLRRQLSAAAEKLQELRKRHVELQGELDQALEVVTASEEFLWPSTPTDLGPKLMPLPKDKANAWFRSDMVATISEATCTQFWLERDRPGIPPQLPDAAADAELEGVRYRESEPGAFVVRLSPGPGKPGEECSTNKGEEEFRMPAEVHQFGRLMTLPFTNRMFQKNALAATWDEAGGLTMISYGEQSASAETLAKLVGESVDSYRDMRASRRGEELAELKADNETLQARITNAELMGKLNAPVDANLEVIANFDADRRLSEAETAAINAEIALTHAQAERTGMP